MERTPGQNMNNTEIQSYARVMLWNGPKVLVLHNIERNRWEFPGGKAEFAEDTYHAARREVQEETGLIAHELKFVRAIPRVFADHEACGFYFACQNDWEGELKLEPKFDEYRWVTLNELADLIQIPRLCVDVARLYRSEL